MKFTIQFLILAACSFLFLGCCPKPEIRTEYVYMATPIPAVPLRPVFKEYTIESLEFNNNEFFILDPVNAAILGLNWEESKAYTKKLEAILNSLAPDNNISTK